MKILLTDQTPTEPTNVSDFNNLLDENPEEETEYPEYDDFSSTY
jgi:hypothetical protein